MAIEIISEFSQIQHGDFPQFFVCLPEGIHSLLTNIDRYYIVHI